MMYNLKIGISTGEGEGSRLRLVYETATENEKPQPQHTMACEAGKIFSKPLDISLSMA